jgi:hypothetical protein
MSLVPAAIAVSAMYKRETERERAACSLLTSGHSGARDDAGCKKGREHKLVELKYPHTHTYSARFIYTPMRTHTVV